MTVARSRNVTAIDDGRCWHCDAAVAGDDRYCRRCGEGQGAYVAWYYRPLWIAVLTVTMMGPFTLPLLWRTPLLSRTAKFVFGAVIVVITLYVGWRVGVAVRDVGELLDSI